MTTLKGLVYSYRQIPLKPNAYNFAQNPIKHYQSILTNLAQEIFLNLQYLFKRPLIKYNVLCIPRGHKV